MPTSLLTTLPDGAPEISGPEVVAVVLMLAGVMMLAFLMVMRTRAKIARRQAETLPPKERLEKIRSDARLRDDVHSLEAGMLDTTRRLVATIDGRSERLEQLIAQADARIAELERAGGAASPPQEAPLASAPVSAAALVTEERRAPVPPRVENNDVQDPLTAAVYALSDDGHQPVDIARELDEQIGKVELILALREV
ncbi:MAG: hypothetical protein GY715_19925 [Planctomycetes bacterium]|nr:hypothetical protein [Planctomycetota bacterium]